MKKVTYIALGIITLAYFLCACLGDLPIQPRLTQLDVYVQPDISVVGKQGLAKSYEDCGQRVGYNPCNINLRDQNDLLWQLYDNHGKIVVLDFSTLWCGVCVGVANKFQTILADYPEKDIVWATILLQDQYGNLPNLDHVRFWAETFDIQHSPVLVADITMVKLMEEHKYMINTLPTIIVIDEDMIIQYILLAWNEPRVRLYLDSLM